MNIENLGCVLVIILSLMSLDVEAEDPMECLAKNIYHEARGEPREGQLAIAHVVFNRVADPRWPDTVCSVVYQRKQFSWANVPGTTETDRVAYSYAYGVAIDAYMGKDNTSGSTHYHALWMGKAWWAKDYQPVKIIGNHIFYR